MLQIDLAKAAKISTQMISDLENQKVGTRTSTADRIAEALSCKTAELFVPDAEATNV